MKQKFRNPVKRIYMISIILLFVAGYGFISCTSGTTSDATDGRDSTMDKIEELKSIRGPEDSLTGAGYLEINNSRYYYYIAKLETDNVYIHNNTRKSGGQSLKDVLDLLKLQGMEVQMLTNGGMYTPAFGPQGLLIENYKEIRKLDTLEPDNKTSGNFYMKPNGVFYIDSSGFHVSTTVDYKNIHKNARPPQFATQSGPMLIYSGRKNSEFKNGSSNVNIRSGVGMISNNKVVFIISDSRVNFYDFATVFDDIFKCKNALYLDGAISSMYFSNPKIEKLKQANTDGSFGPVISVSKRKK
jgi:uncharacterized protein YigE (DUF2233 family)